MEPETIRNLIQAEVRAVLSVRDGDKLSVLEAREKDASMAFECLRKEDLRLSEDLYNRIRSLERRAAIGPDQ